MKKYMAILGKLVSDRVTGFSGVATTVAFDLYGCVQIVVTPLAKDGKIEDGRWFDHKRLNVTDNKPVMDVPTFEQVPGGAEKSLPNRY